MAEEIEPLLAFPQCRLSLLAIADMPHQADKPYTRIGQGISDNRYFHVHRSPVFSPVRGLVCTRVVAFGEGNGRREIVEPPLFIDITH